MPAVAITCGSATVLQAIAHPVSPGPSTNSSQRPRLRALPARVPAARSHPSQFSLMRQPSARSATTIGVSPLPLSFSFPIRLPLRRRRSRPAGPFFDCPSSTARHADASCRFRAPDSHSLAGCRADVLLVRPSGMPPDQDLGHLPYAQRPCSSDAGSRLVAALRLHLLRRFGFILSVRRGGMSGSSF